MSLRLGRPRLGTTGRPELVDGESVLLTLASVDASFRNEGSDADVQFFGACKGGLLVLTTYRLAWVPSPDPGTAAGVPFHVPLAAVLDVAHKPRTIVLPARARFQLRVAADDRPALDPGAGVRTARLRAAGRAGDLQGLVEAARMALRERAWARAPTGQLAAMVADPGDEATERLVAELAAMGFDPRAAGAAVRAVGQADVQAAVEWLLEDPRRAETAAAPPPAGGSTPAGPLRRAAGTGASVGSDWRYGDGGGARSYGGSTGRAEHDGRPSGGAGAGGGPAPAVRRADSGSSLNPLLSLQPAPPVPAPIRASLSGVGVAAVLAREERRAAEVSGAMDVALEDLGALMSRGEEMVALAKEFKARIGAGATSPPEGPADDSALLDAETAEALEDLGVLAPVTRAGAGARYHDELARQLSDFLDMRLGANGGTGGALTLPDVFCFYNRARGTDLVSPHDLLRALEAFPKLGLPHTLLDLPSGERIVSTRASEARAAQIIDGLLSRDGRGTNAIPGAPVSAADLAGALGIPLALARERLEAEEQKGRLCRDEGLGSVAFYRNYFVA